MPDAVAELLPDPVRREVMLDGNLYSWPFLLDVTILGWNGELVEKAELDPNRAPRTWDELIETSRAVVNSGAAPYGCTFDPRPWRSLVPITYSFSTDVYDENGLFDFRNDAVLAALEVLRQMRELANPDVLEGRLTAGAGLTPDEGVFAAGLAAYYVKYQNAHIRNAATWPDPGRLVLARLPRPPTGEGKTVFWTTGIGLIRFSPNGPAAARYARTITESDDFWRTAIGGGRAAVGHVPALDTTWSRWQRERPSWLEGWADRVREQLGYAEPIRLSTSGAAHFLRAQPELDSYLRGEEPSARRALERAAAAAG